MVTEAAPPFAVFRKVGVDAAAGTRPLRGAEAPLFHGAARVLVVLGKIKIKVKGVGQECPTHTTLALR
jgi:hypothetical protein